MEVRVASASRLLLLAALRGISLSETTTKTLVAVGKASSLRMLIQIVFDVALGVIVDRIQSDPKISEDSDLSTITQAPKTTSRTIP